MEHALECGEEAPHVLRDQFKAAGWYAHQHAPESWRQEGNLAEPWSLHWKCGGFKVGDYLRCKPWQRINHFPKSGSIAKKDQRPSQRKPEKYHLPSPHVRTTYCGVCVKQEWCTAASMTSARRHTSFHRNTLLSATLMHSRTALGSGSASHQTSVAAERSS